MPDVIKLADKFLSRHSRRIVPDADNTVITDRYLLLKLQLSQGAITNTICRHRFRNKANAKAFPYRPGNLINRSKLNIRLKNQLMFSNNSL